MADNLYQDGVGESAASIDSGSEALSETAAAQAAVVQIAQVGVEPLVLTKPPAGQLSGPHNVVPGQNIVTDFPTEDADVCMDGPRLIITFDDGARIEIANFGAVDPVPDLILQDGTVLAGGVVVAHLGACAAEKSARRSRYRMDCGWIGGSGQYDPIRQLRLGTARCRPRIVATSRTSPCFCRRTCRSGFPRVTSLTTSATWLMHWT